ncbi:class I SAM-dependent methyltransferase [Thiomicrorhabdus indica]|uniref:class I SAM-dependent methyltransferase n=1 Tax=Thiomicrorhabdus indica TaxID=2267253 RepID=UPI00102DDDE6|nr:class I SAM-dependent methyltransferase [Thiomicrorhabdus indica]
MTKNKTLPAGEKWDLKYSDSDLNTPTTPCYALKEHSHLLPFYGKALDLACGLGGNARFLAQCGLKVDAWDISDNALTILNNWASLNHLPIQPLLTDLKQMLLPYQQYDVIVVSRYLDRKLFKQIEQALKPNGLLFYQSFLEPMQENAPKNPDFYLKSGELTQSFKNLQCLINGEGWLNDSIQQDAPKYRYSWFVGKKP